MKRIQVRIILVEESVAYASSLLSFLNNSGYDLISKRVDSEADFFAAISEESWDVIVADSENALFPAASVLAVIQEKKIKIPSVIISEKMSEEIIVEAMRGGAFDFILKSNIARLIPALEKAVDESGKRKRHADDEILLVESSLQLKRINDDLKEMLYVASHDLQSPISSIASYSGMLLNEFSDKLDDNMKHAISRIKLNAERMRSLIASLLDVSRINTRQNINTFFNPSEIIDEVKKELEITIMTNSVAIETSGMPNIYGDKERFFMVYRNLITNSVNYGAKKIEIGFLPGKGFFVKDDGIGIPGEQLEKIFKPGERLREIDVEGSGMGLTFCKKIIELHCGKIWAESAGKNCGTTFFFSLEG